MKITAAWWEDKNALLPTDPAAFDYGDTTLAILNLSGLTDALGDFRKALAQIVPDTDMILHNSTLNNLEYGLLAVKPEVRAVIAQVLFAVKNPKLPRNPSSSASAVQDLSPISLQAVKAMVERVDESAQRLGADAPASSSYKKPTSGRLQPPLEADEAFLRQSMSNLMGHGNTAEMIVEVERLGGDVTSTSLLPGFWALPLSQLRHDAPKTFDLVMTVLRARQIAPVLPVQPPVGDTPRISMNRDMDLDTHVVEKGSGVLRAADVAAYAAAERAKKDPLEEVSRQTSFEALSQEANDAHMRAQTALDDMKSKLAQKTTLPPSPPTNESGPQSGVKIQ